MALTTKGVYFLTLTDFPPILDVTKFMIIFVFQVLPVLSVAATPANHALGTGPLF